MNSDNILIEKILSGDTEAFTALVKKYQNRVYGFLLNMTLSREDAEDLTQNTFINIYKSLYKFKKDKNFLPWAFKIALNEYKAYYSRNKKKLSTLYIEDLPEEVGNTFEDNLSILERNENLKYVLSIINELKKGQKQVFILKFGKGFTFKEVGEVLGISETAARMKYFRAKESLIKKYKSSNEKE